MRLGTLRGAPPGTPICYTNTTCMNGEDPLVKDGSIHRAFSPDGTALAGRIHGQGPPLLLVHGGLDDGENGWQALLPSLSPHFTCDR